MDSCLHFLVIHLEKHVDRKILFKKRMKHLPKDKFHFEFVKAIEHADGREGCRLSHIKCIQIAKQRKWKYCWVLEDDVLFINPSKLVNEFKQYSPFYGTFVDAIPHPPQLEQYHAYMTKLTIWMDTIYNQLIIATGYIEQGQIDVFHGGSSTIADEMIAPRLFYMDNDIPETPVKRKLQGTLTIIPFHLQFDKDYDEDDDNCEWNECDITCKLKLSHANYENYQYVQSHFTGSHCVCYGEKAFDVVINSFEFYHIDQFITHCGTAKGICLLKTWKYTEEAKQFNAKCDYCPPLLNICTIFPFLAIAYSSVSSIRNEECETVDELKMFYDTECEIHYWIEKRRKMITT